MKAPHSWIKERVFLCEPYGKAFFRLRSDGRMFFANLPNGVEYGEIVNMFGKFIKEKPSCPPCDEDEFDSTFDLNMSRYNGREIYKSQTTRYNTINRANILKLDSCRRG